MDGCVHVHVCSVITSGLSIRKGVLLTRAKGTLNGGIEGKEKSVQAVNQR